MHIYSCLWSLVIAYATYACLCSFIYLLMGHDISEGIFRWTMKYGRKEVFNLVLYQERRIYEYVRTYPHTVLSFFLSSSRNVLYYFPIHHLSNTHLSPTD
jgi:hypothetical protein